MTQFPEFTEENGSAISLYFDASGKDDAALRREIESAYPCGGAGGFAMKNGKRYFVLTVEDV